MSQTIEMPTLIGKPTPIGNPTPIENPPLPPLNEQIQYILNALNNEFDKSDLEKIKNSVINMAYEYLKSVEAHLKSHPETDTTSQILALKDQLKQIIILSTQDSEYDLITHKQKDKAIFNVNKKRINNLFLELFYDSFNLYKTNWNKLTEDEKKQKDYFRYLEEKLSTIRDIAKFKIGSGLEFKKLTELTEDQKVKIRAIIQNSFIVGDEERFVVPAVYENTYEMDAYRRYVDEIMYPEGYAGGAKKQNKSRHHISKSIKCSHRNARRINTRRSTRRFRHHN
jgi:hypothetical protein